MELELRGALTALDQDCPSQGSEGLAEWKTADVKARAVIMSGLTDEQLTYVEEAKTAREMMANLTDVYAKLGGKHQAYLLKDLGRMNLTSKEDCEKHINECVQLLQDLELTGFKLDENQRVWIFLGTLDEDVFGPFSNEVFRRDTNRFKNVLGELRSYCTSFKHRECKDSNYKLQGKPQNKGQVICFRCEGKGHIARECPTPENHPNSYPSKGRTKGRNNRREGRNAFQWNVSSRDSSPDRRPPQRSAVSQDPSTVSNMLLRDKLLSTSQSNPSSRFWIVDSGASSHSTSIEQFFHSLDKSTGKVVVASGQTLDVAGKGKGRLRCKAGGRIIDTVVHDVLYVPGLQGNTLSVPQLDKKGFCVRFSNGKCTIRKDNNLVAQAFLQDGVYVLDLAQDKIMSAKGSSDEESMALWHRRLGHRDTNAILDLQRRKLATGIKVKSRDNQVGRCTVCVRGKGCRPSFPQRCEQRTTRPLELVHSDLCGPFQVPSFAENEKIEKRNTFFSKSPEPDKKFVLVPAYQEPAPEANSQAERKLAEGTNSEANNPKEGESDQPEEVQEAGIPTERDHLPAQEPRQSSRENKGVPPPRLSYSARLVEGHDPESWTEIERMPTTEAEKWKNAAREEMAALQKNKTWTLTELPPGKKAIGCKCSVLRRGVGRSGTTPALRGARRGQCTLPG